MASDASMHLARSHDLFNEVARIFQKHEAGQTLLDVCAAEQALIRHVRALHPESPKPVIVGNCQGG